MTAGASIAALPHALRDRDELMRHYGGRRPAVFLDYDGTLTPIVDRPGDAVISGSMRSGCGDLRSAARFASWAAAIVVWSRTS